jgi:hypothetical protein
MKTTKEKIAVMQAYEDGKTIEIKHYGLDVVQERIKENDDELNWDWNKNDYSIKQESNQTLFSISDSEFLVGLKIRNPSVNISGICVEVREGGITLGKWDIDYHLLSTNCEYYDEKTNTWIPCIKQ